VTDTPVVVDESPGLEEVRPGVYAWVQPDGSWWLNNAGAVAGEDGLVVIDTCATASRTRRFLQSLDSAAGGKPIRVAVNTHQHGDHTYGNCLLPSGTVLIGHELMREGLRQDLVIDGCPPFWEPVPDWGPVVRRLPDITVRSSLTLHVGGRRVELLHPGGPAHTHGDLVAWLPVERVLFAGDLLFAGLTPLVFMGSLTGALDSLDWLAGFGPRVVVPGHGRVLDGSEIEGVLEEHRRYYRFVLALAGEGIAAGRTPLAVAHDVDLGEFSDWPDAERLVLNLHRAYADAAGSELDVPAAFADAVAWRGGPMHTSV
jgi:cyclase